MKKTPTLTLGPKQLDWIAFLEGTKKFKRRKVRQGHGWLFNDNLYCCLGVLEVCVLGNEPRMVGKFWRVSGRSDYSGNYKQLGLRGRRGELKNQDAFLTAIKAAGYTGKNCEDLADYNDHGATFYQIAAAIRAVPHAVFSESL